MYVRACMHEYVHVCVFVHACIESTIENALCDVFNNGSQEDTVILRIFRYSHTI